MRCPDCDYSLWNLRTRECPECGRVFRPSEFDFQPNQVRFGCPHCDQPYFGTGPRGHLEPTRFECVRCRRPVDMNEMILRPAGEESDAGPGMPWLERRERGRVKAWFQTVIAAMVKPISLARSIPPERHGAAWWFAFVSTVVTTLGVMLPLLPIFIMPIFMASRMGGGGGPTTGRMVGIMAGVTGVTFLSALMANMIFIVGWGLATHGLLAMTGGVKHGLSRTYQLICFGSGANVVSVVPCVGFLGWLWWVVSAILMIHEGQRVRPLRAALTTAIPPVTVAIGFVILYAWFIVQTAAIGGAGAQAAAAAANATAETSRMATALRSYADDQGTWPRHAAELATAGVVAPADFVATATQRSPGEVSVGSGTLRDFIDDPLKMETLAAEAASLTADAVVHRMGDFVFTYQGVDPAAEDAGLLWTVIHAPFRDSGIAVELVAGRADGSILPIPWHRLQEVLANQNELRAKNGLAAIPDPLPVTETTPVAPRAPSG